MAEEQTIEEKVPGTAIPGEKLPGEGDKTVPLPMTIEEYAKTKGHIPLEDWHGNPEDYIDAKTFVDNEWKIASKLKNQVQKLTETTDYIKTHMESMIDKEVNSRLSVLEEQRQVAIKDGDVDEVLRIEKDIKAEEKSAHPEDKTDPAAKAWMEKNEWYGITEDCDRDLTDLADGVLAKELDNGKTIEQALKTVDARVANFKKTRIEGEKKVETKPIIPEHNTVISGTPPDDGGTKKTFTYNDLDETQKQFCDKFVGHGAGTREQYITQLVKSNGGKLR